MGRRDRRQRRAHHGHSRSPNASARSAVHANVDINLHSPRRQGAEAPLESCTAQRELWSGFWLGVGDDVDCEDVDRRAHRGISILSLGMNTIQGPNHQSNEDRAVTLSFGPRKDHSSSEHQHDLPENAAYFAVFDGHGGAEAAQFAADHLHYEISRSGLFDEESMHCQADLDVDEVVTGSDWLSRARESLLIAFNEVHSKFVMRARQKNVTAGACLAVAIIYRSHIIAASAGDCGILILQADSENYHVLATRHQATLPEEHARIIAAGGVVQFGRLMGVLEPSRGIGDIDILDSLPAGSKVLISDPDVQIYSLLPGSKEHILMLATDGAFDAMPIDQLTRTLIELVKKKKARPDRASDASSKLSRICARRSRDDTTIIVACIGSS